MEFLANNWEWLTAAAVAVAAVGGVVVAFLTWIFPRAGSNAVNASEIEKIVERLLAAQTSDKKSVEADGFVGLDQRPELERQSIR